MRKECLQSWCHASLLAQLSTNHCVSTISKPYAGKRQACRRFSFRSRRAMRLLLLAYATIVILLGWWPWHILLLALIAARNPRPSQNCETCGTRPLTAEANHHTLGKERDRSQIRCRPRRRPGRRLAAGAQPFSGARQQAGWKWCYLRGSKRRSVRKVLRSSASTL